jgi:hypothetical protein
LPKTPHAEKTEAEIAIAAIGTNAIPFLLKWLRYEPPLWRSLLANLQRRFAVNGIRDRRDELSFYATRGIMFLGLDANDAIPALVDLAKGKKSLPRARAYKALMYLRAYLVIYSMTQHQSDRSEAPDYNEKLATVKFLDYISGALQDIDRTHKVIRAKEYTK